jgi:alanine dehydrogenase
VALLAPPCIQRIAIIGSGTQARFQLRAISEIATWQEAHAWSPHTDRCEAYCAEMSTRFDKPVRRAASIEAAVRDADVIVTTTPSRAALVCEPWVKPGATVVAIGADSPGKQELDPQLLVKADKVVVDLERQASTLGELQHAPEPTVHAELGIVLTRQRPGRESEDERIVCDLTGTGAQDAAMAEAVWNACQSNGRYRLSR